MARKKPSKIDAARAALSELTYEQIVKLAHEAALEAKARETDWKKVVRTCPRCGREGNVDPMFGIKSVRGVVSPQSWCSECRAETAREYRQRARKKILPRS